MARSYVTVHSANHKKGNSYPSPQQGCEKHITITWYIRSLRSQILSQRGLCVANTLVEITLGGCSVGHFVLLLGVLREICPFRLLAPRCSLALGALTSEILLALVLDKKSTDEQHGTIWQHNDAYSQTIAQGPPVMLSTTRAHESRYGVDMHKPSWCHLLWGIPGFQPGELSAWWGGEIRFAHRGVPQLDSVHCRARAHPRYADDCESTLSVNPFYCIKATRNDIKSISTYEKRSDTR